MNPELGPVTCYNIWPRIIFELLCKSVCGRRTMSNCLQIQRL